MYQGRMQEMSTKILENACFQINYIMYSVLIKGLFQPGVKYLFLQNFLMCPCRLSLHNTMVISI